MRSIFTSLGAMVGTVVAGVLVGTILVVLGLEPVLGVLAGLVVGLDILFYRRDDSVDTAGAWDELTDRSRTARR